MEKVSLITVAVVNSQPHRKHQL